MELFSCKTEKIEYLLTDKSTRFKFFAGKVHILAFYWLKSKRVILGPVMCCDVINQVSVDYLLVRLHTAGSYFNLENCVLLSV